jgi:uncharacterized protein (DUF885 family)
MNDIRRLADELAEVELAADPVEATLLGVPGYDDRLGEVSEAAELARRDRLTDIAARAERLEVSTMDQDDRVTHAMVAHHARAQVDWIDSRFVEYAITNIFVAPASSLLTTLPMIALPSADHARAYVNRLRAVPDYLAGVADRHRVGAAAGRYPVRRLVRRAVAHLDRYLADALGDPLLRPRIPSDANGLTAERERVLTDLVRPAFADYRDVLAAEFIEPGREDDRVGVCWLPGGEEIYAGLSRVHTTTERTPEALHQTGRELIARLREEYAEIGSRVFGTSDQREIFARMTSDPDLRWSDGDALLAAAVATVERAEAEAPRWFGRLPRQRCTVEPVPPADAPGAPAAYYLHASMDGTRPGTYFVNTDRPHERDRFLAEVMAFHEAVPGHHFQHTIALELNHLPLLRRIANVNAYAEGWGLYTERLADEMGLYTSDLDRLGMLAVDSLRAGRLVVDTGIHAKGWSRERAVRYLRENTPLSNLEIGNEVDRYIAYAGQALSYMVGRLEILRIRQAAQQRLGSRFDIRAFHDLLLGGGPLPLAVLDDVISAWSPR